MSPRMQEIITRIFTVLQGRYGTDFTRKFSTGVNERGVDPGFENAKIQWAIELKGFEFDTDSISYALNHLDPDRPPNAPQFRAICNRAPAKEVPMLPHKLTEEDVARNRARLAEITAMLAKKQRMGGE